MYHTPYNETLRNLEVHDIMEKLVETIYKNNIPFSFLVGDLTTFMIIVQLKAENAIKFEDLISI